MSSNMSAHGCTHACTHDYTQVHETFGNKIVFGRFGFDLGFADRIDCVWRTKQQIDMFKISPETAFNGWLFQNLLPKFTDKQLMDIVKAPPPYTMVRSNVPGPQSQVTLFGKAIDDIQFYAYASLGVYFGIISYNGQIRACLAKDAKLVEDPKSIGKYWKTEFDALYEEVERRGFDASCLKPSWPGRPQFFVKSFIALSVACYSSYLFVSCFAHFARFTIDHLCWVGYPVRGLQTECRRLGWV